jgi:hypothetical protein
MGVNGMISITLGEVRTITIEEYPQYTFGVRILPRGIISQARLAIAEAYSPYMSLTSEEKGSHQGNQLAATCYEAAMPASERLVSFGLASINGEPVPSSEEQYEGRIVARVSPDVIDALAHVSAGSLIDRLAGKIMAANDLRPEDVLGFRSPSGS